MFVTLDVCHTHSAAVSAGADVPVIAEAHVVVPAVCCEDFLEVSSFRFRDLFTPSLEEDPPKA